ncbi:MAG: hypothetical protein E7A62_03130 [Actinomycetaceae bacterium]|nr:hypothetical protein [Actinomycetaceae bacterium]MDU0969976.1 hypothetical protein [Actinomycetaceae bacterium]
MFNPLRRQFARTLVAHEKTTPLDNARYVAVATGRLEPYLRALAHIAVWAPAKPQLTSVEGATLLQVWGTKPRATLADLPADAGGISAVNVLEYYAEHADLADPQVGLVVDPGLESELTVEASHLPTIEALQRGDAIVEAFSAIGAEELVAAPAYRDPEGDLAALTAPDATEAHLADLLEDGQTVLRVEALVAGSPGGSPTYRVYFIQAADQSFPPLPPEVDARLSEAAGADRVLVNPATPDWRRDLLWDLRAWAVPLG